jgi:RNA polymerase sigma factor (sigma-70 family)
MAATEAGSRAARALDELYRRHAREVYRYAYAMLGNRSDAEDVAQATFINALRALERGDRPRKPSSWLLAIAHNIVRQRFRQAQARPLEVELDYELAAAEPEDDSGPTVRELLKALSRIPPAQREAIVMREFEGRSYSEIAEILGVSTSALETLLFRARRSLADELENVVTCDLAELAISRRIDGRLSRKERRRLEQHLDECAACARFEQLQRRGRRALKGLALLPIPASLTLFKGTPGAAAATALPTIGTATTVGAGGAGAAGGGLAVGGLALKAATVVSALGIAGGVGYSGVQHLGDKRSTPVPAGAKVTGKPANDTATNTPTGTHGKAEGTEKVNVAKPHPNAPGTAGAGESKAAKQARKDEAATEPRAKPDRTLDQPVRQHRMHAKGVGTCEGSSGPGVRQASGCTARQAKQRKASHARPAVLGKRPARSTKKHVSTASEVPTKAKPAGHRATKGRAAPDAAAAGPAAASGKHDSRGSGKPSKTEGGKPS